MIVGHGVHEAGTYHGNEGWIMGMALSASIVWESVASCPFRWPRPSEMDDLGASLVAWGDQTCASVIPDGAPGGPQAGAWRLLK